MMMKINSWDDENLDLKNNLLRGIYSHGFEKPSNIQQKSINLQPHYLLKKKVTPVLAQMMFLKV